MFNSLVEAKRFMEEKHIQMVDFMMIDLKMCIRDREWNDHDDFLQHISH